MNRKSDVEESSRRPADGSEHFETVIIGGGQAGLSVGYHLKRQDRPFVILDTNERIGDSWRKRWDSLRLFTPARYNGLTGLPFPSPAVSFPTKDEMADYLEAYAARFDLPVRTGVKVDGLSREEADKMNAGIYTTFKNNGAFVMPAGIDDGVSVERSSSSPAGPCSPS
jgi:putative flavoprotein involved in K+ transport